jgi:hypothetical protein
MYALLLVFPLCRPRTADILLFKVEEFLQEAQQFARADGLIDYRAFAAMMASEDE